MLAKQRQQTILAMLKENGSVRTIELAGYFSVSDQTIRRDFWELEERGLVTKGHGGAILVNYWAIPYRDRTVLKASEKLAIADAAQRLVRPGMKLALGPGTTTEALAHMLNGRDVDIFTNSLAVAKAVTEPVTRVLLTGGVYRPRSELLTGEWALQNLSDKFIDMSFVGVSGIDEADGYTVTERDEAEVLRQLIRIAKTAVILGDASKFGRVAHVTVAPLNAVHFLITDSNAKIKDLELLARLGVDATTVGPASEAGDFS